MCLSMQALGWVPLGLGLVMEDEASKLSCCCLVSIINHTLPSIIRAVIGTLICTSMASTGTDPQIVLGGGY